MVLAAFAPVHVKIATMIRMVNTGKLKLWRHSKPQIGIYGLRCYFKVEVWFGKCRMWKGARANGFPKIADDMRMVKVRTDSLRIRSIKW